MPGESAEAAADERVSLEAQPEASDAEDEAIGKKKEDCTAEKSDNKEKTMPAKYTKKKKKVVVPVNLMNCKYDAVRWACRQLNLKEVGDGEDWQLFWTDTSVGLERVAMMKPYQRINHFPGMCEITRKDFLARNISRMVRNYTEQYDFAPKSWILPADFADLQNVFRKKRVGKSGVIKCLIVKPDSGCQVCFFVFVFFGGGGTHFY